MHLKLDENIGNRGANLLRDVGHDVATVKDIPGKLWVIQRGKIREYQPDN